MPASAECLQYLAREVERGTSQLWECTDGVDTLRVITRIDRNPRELVICLAVGRGALKFVPLFLEKAREVSLPVRLHTESRAVVRLARRLGFHMAEYVVRMSHGN